MRGFGARLKIRARQLGMSDAEVAREAGLTPNRYGNYTNDRREPDLDTLGSICRVLKISADRLLGLAAFDHRSEDPDAHRPNTDGLRIPHLDVRVSAGGGALVESEDTAAMWELPLGVARRISRRGRDGLSFIEVAGDSMEPTLRHGEPVLVSIDPADLDPYSGGIFVINDGTGTMIKRLEYIPRSNPVRYRVISDNDRYQAFELDAAEIHILARVLASLHVH